MSETSFRLRGATSKTQELQEKINELRAECGKMQNINNAYDFDEDKHDKLIKRIERLEYLKWCSEYEDNRRRNWN